MNGRLQAFVGAKITEFKRQMAEVSATLKKTATGANVPIDANIKPISTRIDEVKAKLKSIRDKTVTIKANIDKNWDKFGTGLDDLATRMRTFGTIGQSSMRGFIALISSAAIPAVASLATGIGSLGPILAAAAGGALGIGTSFAMAGAGVAAFSAVAITNLSGVFDANKKITDLQTKAAQATDIKERNKYLQQEKAILVSMTGPQRQAYEAIQKLKTAWTGITRPLETQTVNIFTRSVQGLIIVLGYLKPAFAGATDAMSALTSVMNQALQSKDAVNFFKTLGDTIGPSLEALGAAGINVMLGLMNLFSAFVPIGQKANQGIVAMSRSFLNWSETVSKSQGFQAFTQYIETNVPKLLMIIGNLGAGLIGMFTGFAPSASNMLDYLVQLSAGFRTWGQTLSQNQQFQQFLAYVNQNAPNVLTVLGNLVQIIVALAQGFAPVGAAVLRMLVPFTQWVGQMLSAHPTIAGIIAIVASLIGVLTALYPTIMSISVICGVASAAVISLGMAMSGAGAAQTLTFSNALRVVIQGIIGWIASLASGITAMAVWTAAMVTAVARTVASWVMMGVQATANALRVAAAWTISTGASMITAVASMIATAAIFVARWVWMGTQALIQAARMAAAWFIALGPIGWVTAAVIAIVALVIANWKTVSSWTSKIWGALSSWLGSLWNGMRSLGSSIFGSIKNTVSNLVHNTASNISSAWNNAKSWTSSAWSWIRSNSSNTWSDIRGTVSSLASRAASDISSAWSRARSSTSSMFGNMFNTAKGILNSMVSWVGGLPGRVGSSIAKNVNNAVGGIKKLAQTLVDKFKSLLGIHSPSKVFQNLGHYVVQGLVNGLSGGNLKSLGMSVLQDFGGGVIRGWDAVKGFFTGLLGGGGSGSDVTSWLTAALGVTHTSLSWLPGLQKLVSAESGGNPSAINPQKVMGQHATGLLQMLPSTFAANQVAGLGSIMSPVANAAAAINYMKRRYGSVYNTPLFQGGSYKGYATGGTPSHEWAIAGEAGPELIHFGSTSRVFNNADTEKIFGNMKTDSRPLTVYLQVGSRTIAKAIIDDINKLQGKQVANNAVFH